jgi:hypothetical protein
MNFDDIIMNIILVIPVGVIFWFIGREFYQLYKDLSDNSSNTTGNTSSNYFKVIKLGEIKQRTKLYKINPYKRYCGVEIECLNKNKDLNSFNKQELFNLLFSQYEDSSLSTGKGIEFCSKPLNGDLLFNKIDEFCDKLKERNYYINNTCGLHIHLEVKQTLENLKKIYIFYNKFEKFFFKMHPISRQNSTFCEKFSRIYHHKWEDISKINTLNKFKEKIYDTTISSADRQAKRKWNSKRYCWANFHSIFYRGTLEIRSHSGTINKEKIKNWFRIHLIILDYLEKEPIKNIINIKSEEEIFLNLFPNDLQNYIKLRWNTFDKYNNENDLVMEEN